MSKIVRLGVMSEQLCREAIGIQEVVGYTKRGRRIQSVSYKSLREARGRHTDIGGTDRDATARVAGHAVRTREVYYKKGDSKEDKEIVRSHHPLMKEENREKMEEK